MTIVVSLFQSESEATKALDNLAQLDFDEPDIEVISSIDDFSRSPYAVAAIPQADKPTAIPAMFPDSLRRRLTLGEEEAQFFAQGLRGDGVLVVADVDDEEAEALAAFFREQGGRTAGQD